MQIDWFTVAAQIANFLLLVYLLKRFLYGPVVAAMDRREQRIAVELEEAGRQAADAAREAADYRERQRRLDEERASLLEAARADAERERKALVAAARAEADDRRRAWTGEAEAERQGFLRRLKRELASRLLAIAAAAFRELADADVEERAIRIFTRRLAAMEGEERERLVAACRDAPGDITMATAFEPSEGGREMLREAARELVGAQVALRFERAPELLLGVELRAPGRSVAWSLADYLEGLAETLDKALAGTGLPAARATAEGRR